MELHSFDFQIQTTASDGKHSSAECVRMAKQNGLHTIAITDHDTVAGVAEAMAEGEKLGVKVIPGIEISADEHHMHILGFGVDIHNPLLLASLAKSTAARRERAKEMVGRLAADGFSITWADVMAEAKGDVIARPHIVEAILKHPENKQKLGGVTTKGEFFKQFFGDNSKYYVYHPNISAKDAIHMIHDAGGIAIWSHPPIPDFLGKCQELEDFLKDLMGWGLDGLEAIGPFLTASDAECLDDLAKHYKLLCTAGSDFHEVADPGDKPWPRSAATIGEFPTYGYSLEGIVEGLLVAIRERHSSPVH